MPLKVAFQMDPIEHVDIDADSSFRLAEAAQARGHTLFVYGPDQLSYQSGRIMARGRHVDVSRTPGAHASFGDWREIDLGSLDVIWLRQDPPFDMSYITTTHLLERLGPGVLVVNDPNWVRNAPEKLFVLNYPQLMPPTAIARDLETIRSFRAKYKDIIVKPLFGNGGAGVFRLKPDDTNLASLHEMFTTASREPLMVQQFLPDVSAGDKRIILVDGEPVGAINRVPAAGETRSNMHVGGRPEKSDLTE
ncbi:MAG: glutathione synthase, partial [Pseudomonadota bacterium]